MADPYVYVSCKEALAKEAEASAVTKRNSWRDYYSANQLDVVLVEAYNSLMLRRLPANSPGDVHHILPKCLGGDDEESNLVLLSTLDHAKAHCILQAMHMGSEHYKDLAGATRLTTGRVN